MSSDLLQRISQNKKLFKPAIYGINSIELNDEEKKFFSKNSCLGFILFARNIVNKSQLKKLTDSLRELMDGEILILIDQEGGRVSRLKPPEWNPYPTGKYFSDLYSIDQKQARLELFNNYQQIANDLVEVGINVNCAPVLDILTSKTHEVIGDRAFGDNPWQVSDLGQQVCDGLLSKGVFPVIKHIPGHGRGSCDSHLELPVVDTSVEDLNQSDFIPFKKLSNQKFAMTAHILYQSIDKNNCATISKNAINLIRNQIGFKNILMSDDLSMKALASSFTIKTQQVLNAGCDLVLHCNGSMTEMQEINSVLPKLSEDFWIRFTQ
ncbi:MAG: beta-N-acetylhexosaminidase [Proteobacteria bacterium]|nr:beta-N-acetylhexosaminidase [Pseudomonadota bacterium]NCA27987.1 beta-N-acetylhexosaminidase [Pseudomonadota bacterium]